MRASAAKSKTAGITSRSGGLAAAEVRVFLAHTIYEVLHTCTNYGLSTRQSKCNIPQYQFSVRLRQIAPISA